MQTVQWQTPQQQMTFVRHADGTWDPAGSLLPNTDYDVYATLTNPDPNQLHRTIVKATHSAFGIGLPGGPVDPATTDEVITSQPGPIAVPPANGVATIAFGFHTPPGGLHGCLYATVTTVDGAALTGGPMLQQNTTTLGAPTGAAHTVESFGVINDEAQPKTMKLTLTESSANPSDHASWNPQLVIPAGYLVGGNPSEVTKPAPVSLALSLKVFVLIGLQVSPPIGATAAHEFRIVGTTNGTYVGEVTITVNPVPAPSYAPPAPYVTGGIHSPDVILTYRTQGPLPWQTPGTEVPLFPGTDTALTPSTDYDMSAVVHNPSSTPADVYVRFWEFPGGVAASGILLDVQSARVPASSWRRVTSAKPFTSASAQEYHRCAVLSIYCAAAGAWPDAPAGTKGSDAVTGDQVGALPMSEGGRDWAAWRNTDSAVVHPGQPFKDKFKIIWSTILRPGPGPDPAPDQVTIAVQSQLVPRQWLAGEPGLRAQHLLREGGGPVVTPPYLLSEYRKGFQPESLDLKVTAAQTPKALHPAEPGPGGGVAVTLSKPANGTEIALAGRIPEKLKTGDILLVQITARYHFPAKGGHPACERTIGYLKVLHVV